MTTAKVGAFGTLGVRQVLRTMVESSARAVRKLCAGVPSARALVVAFTSAACDRFAGATAFIGYPLALCQQSIWYKKKWSATIMSMFDGLIYALVTAGTFGWLWPW